MVSISISGVKEALGVLDSDRKNVLGAADSAVREAGLHVLGEVKNSIAGNRSEPRSVEHGDFLNSVILTSGFLECRVFSDLEYAAFLEYGTSRGIFPRGHFGNTAGRERERVLRFVQDSIKNV